MRVLFYSTLIQLEPVLAMIPDLSRKVELHLLLELSPETWSSALFDVPPRKLPSGIVPADEVFRECLPETLHHYWEGAASFNLVVHNCPRSFHPSTLKQSLKAWRHIKRINPDVLHIDNSPLRLAFVLWGLRSIPIVTTVHDPEPHSGEDHWRFRLARSATFRFTRRFVLYNQASKQPFSRNYGIPLDRVHAMLLPVHGMTGDWPHAAAEEESRTVLFFGRLSVYKGLDVLYAAAPEIARRVPGVKFIVAGRPDHGYVAPEPPRLENGSHIERIERYIHNAEASRLFERASLVVCSNYDATQSGVVLTAYGFGKPVVASRVGGMPEYVQDGETGTLVPPGDPAALAQAVADLLTNPVERQRMKRNIQTQVESRLSWKNLASGLARMYEQAHSVE